MKIKLYRQYFEIDIQPRDLPRIFRIKHLTHKDIRKGLPEELACFNGSEYIDQVKSVPLFKEPIDFFHCLAVQCITHTTNIVMLSSRLKKTDNLTESFVIRFTIFFDLYMMVTLEQRLRTSFHFWPHLPRADNNRCFDYYDSSTLSAMLGFCDELIDCFAEWLFCVSFLRVNLGMIRKAADLSFVSWIHKVSMFPEFFNGIGDLDFPEIISGDYNLKAELKRVIGSLHYEFDEMAASLAKDERSNPVGGNEPTNGNEPTKKQPITLEKFIETFCDRSENPDVRSKVELLFKYNRNKKITLITLPPLATPWRVGQYKIFFAEDLTANWRDYQKFIPTLPPLKS